MSGGTSAVPSKIFPRIILVEEQRRHSSSVARITRPEINANHGCYQTCVSWHGDEESRQINTGARWRGKSDLLVEGAQSNPFSCSRRNRVSLRLLLRCEITTQREESLSEERFYGSFGRRLSARRRRTLSSPVTALWEWARPCFFEFLSLATVSRLSISCLINCHYLSRDKKKGGGEREMHFRIKMESENSLKSEM